jgi:hypothetical protein
VFSLNRVDQLVGQDLTSPDLTKNAIARKIRTKQPDSSRVKVKTG